MSRYRERGGLLRISGSSESLHAGGERQPSQTPTRPPSTTEHDYRFPRRPESKSMAKMKQDAAPAASTGTGGNGSGAGGGNGASAGANSKLDSSVAENARNVLGDSFFSNWGSDTATEDPATMQEKDPLATQIWKLYSRQKQSLPNKERMENLTWRMMAMSLRKRKQAEEAARYV